MYGFTLTPVWNDYHDIHHNGRRVAILTPAKPAQSFPLPPDDALPWSIIILMEAFPDLPAKNLPFPLSNCRMAFDTLADVKDFLGIREEEMAA